MFRRILLIVLALALLVGLHAGGMAALRIRQYAHIDETQPADVAIVLGAAAWRNRPSAIYVETNSTDTEENLIEAQKLMQSLGFTSALLVSDPLHMYRIQLLSAEIGLEGFSSPTPTSRYRSSIARVVFKVREV